jgi:hypothetical protein
VERDVTIYVFLLNEGVHVWRPAPARRLTDTTFEVLRPADYSPDAEEWEFPPGSVVECETRELSGGPTFVAVRLAHGR